MIEPQSYLYMLSVDKTKKRKKLVPPGLEPGTFRVLSERDNHYTMELYESEKKSEPYSRTYLHIAQTP